IPGGGGYKPWRCIRSARLMPAAATRTRTSPTAGRGVGTLLSIGLASSTTMAVMVAGTLSRVDVVVAGEVSGEVLTGCLSLRIADGRSSGGHRDGDGHVQCRLGSGVDI